MKKSQTWSMDITLAIAIFIGSILTIYLLFQGNKEGSAKRLEHDANKVLDSISSQNSQVGIVNGINIDEQKLKNLIQTQYPDLKNKIKSDSDFCIFLEDENGKIVYLEGKAGIGSDRIKISGQPCGAIV